MPDSFEGGDDAIVNALNAALEDGRLDEIDHVGADLVAIWIKELQEYVTFYWPDDDCP